MRLMRRHEVVVYTPEQRREDIEAVEPTQVKKQTVKGVLYPTTPGTVFQTWGIETSKPVVLICPVVSFIEQGSLVVWKYKGTTYQLEVRGYNIPFQNTVNENLQHMEVVCEQL